MAGNLQDGKGRFTVNRTTSSDIVKIFTFSIQDTGLRAIKITQLSLISFQTCLQKLSVLSIRDNQIVTLSARSPYNALSGCTLRTSKEETGPSDDRNAK